MAFENQMALAIGYLVQFSEVLTSLDIFNYNTKNLYMKWSGFANIKKQKKLSSFL
jgi:hypothetical protein